MSNQLLNSSFHKESEPQPARRVASAFLDRSSPIPISAQLDRWLRGMIRDEFNDGQKFFTEQQLAKDFAISRSTVQRIMRDLTRDGLLTRQAGRGSFVRKAKSGTPKLTIFLPSIRSGFNAHLLEAASLQADQRKWNFRNVYTELQSDLSEQVSQLGPDDRVLLVAQMSPMLDQFLDLLEAKNTPTVVVDIFKPSRPQLAVGVDNVGGIKLMVEKLVALGHRRIVLFNAEPVEAISIQERFRGFRQAVLEHGLECEGDGIVDAHSGYFDNSFDHAQQYAGQVLDMTPAPTGVICTADSAAWGLLHEAAGRGVKVPEELSVVAFGDDSPSAFQNPPLTVAAQPGDDIIRTAIDQLEQMAGFPTSFKHITLPPKWIERKSVAKPKV